FIQLARDLLHPSLEEEKKKHKKKRLVQSPNSYFMDVKCPGCYKITTVFSHAQTVVLCVGCSTVLCQPTGGKARLTEGIHLAFFNPVLRFYYYKYLPLLKASLKEILNSLLPKEFYL
ncbi:unnamed protein product, partial [Gulo gulo]